MCILQLLGGTGKRVRAHADSIEAYYGIDDLWDPAEDEQDTDGLVATGDADADDEDYKVEGVCGERGNVQRGTKQFLVKWVGYDEPSWNDAEALYGCEKLTRKWHCNQERGTQVSRQGATLPGQPEPEQCWRRTTTTMSCTALS